MDEKRLRQREVDDDESDDLSPLPAVEKVEEVQYMLHKKCAIIKLVRKQMSGIEERVERELKEIKKCKSVLGRLLRNKLLLLCVLLLPFLAWFLFVYGAKMGALLCCGCSIDVFGTGRANPQARNVLF